MAKARSANASGVSPLIILREQQTARRSRRKLLRHEVVTDVLGTVRSVSYASGLDRPAAHCSWTSRSKFAGQTARHLLFCRKRFLAKALPEPDLKYRSSLRAVTSSATATYERRTAGKYLLLPTLLTLRETPFALSVSGWPATRSPTGRRVAEPEGFEPSIGLYNPITV